MEAAVPQGGMVLREMLNRELSEGHLLGLRPLLLPVEGAFAEPKSGGRQTETSELVSD
jgi:hypothetical protein